jgi:hypothetical protein
VEPALVEPLRRWDPEQVGGYVLLGRLGAGAMGQVYLGRSAAGRLVAVKTIKSELAEEPDFRTRFGQEVAAARRVSGAFTAAVVAADSEADVPWLATVYVPAPSLSKLVRTCGPLPPAAVRWLAAGCAEALEAIHSVGLVHRDLKPSNVLVSPDGPRVIDFGVARAAERIQLTVTRGSIGTPAYMAPEQARDTRQATPASDIFSLGATTLFAATGHSPYEGETVMDVLVRLATEPPDLTGLPAELADTVRACMDRDPRSRPTSASIVARLAPRLSARLSASGDLGSAALPPAALELIAEYRNAPATAQWAGAESGGSAASRASDQASADVVPRPRPKPAGETTLGSQPVLRGADPGPVAPLAEYPADSAAFLAVEPGPAGHGPPAARARRRGTGSRAEGKRKAGTQARDARRCVGGRRRRAHRGWLDCRPFGRGRRPPYATRADHSAASWRRPWTRARSAAVRRQRATRRRLEPGLRRQQHDFRGPRGGLARRKADNDSARGRGDLAGSPGRRQRRHVQLRDQPGPRVLPRRAAGRHLHRAHHRSGWHQGGGEVQGAAQLGGDAHIAGVHQRSS